MEVLNLVFHNDVVEDICEIELHTIESPDKLVWTSSKTSTFSIKGSCDLLVESQRTAHNVWKAI